MAELVTLARPYAKAAFEFAQGSGQLDAWSNFLQLGAAAAADPRVKQLLDDPALTSVQKAAKFGSLLDDQLDDARQHFVSVLADNKRLTLLPQVAELFEALKASLEHSVGVHIESAFDIDQAQQDKLKDSLTKKLNREVKIDVTTKPELLGGVVIHAGDTVIDGSVRGKLAKLAESLGA